MPWRRCAGSAPRCATWAPTRARTAGPVRCRAAARTRTSARRPAGWLGSAPPAPARGGLRLSMPAGRAANSAAGLQVQAGVGLDPLGGHRVDVALAQQQVTLAGDLDLVP